MPRTNQADLTTPSRPRLNPHPRLIYCRRRASLSPDPCIQPKRNTPRRQPVRQVTEIATRATVSLANPSKTEIDSIRQPDPSLIRKQRLSSVFSLDSVHLVISPWNVSTIQRSTQCTEIDQKKPARLRITPDPSMPPRHIYRRHDLDIDRIRNTAAADRDRVREVIRMVAGAIVVNDFRQ